MLSPVVELLVKFAKQREEVIAMNEGGQAAAASREDPNLQYLKGNYGVRSLFLHLWVVSVLLRKLQRRCQPSMSHPGSFHRH
jgi:hypothetical protein